MTQRQLFLRYVAQTSDSPVMLEIERAQGMYMYATDGTRYMDLISGISVSNLGHCHPVVVEAVQKQAARFMHLMVYGEYVYSPQVRFAELLCQQLPPHLNNVYLVNSGSEAVEGALKLAKRYTGRSELVGFANAYHGSTHGALSLLGDEYFKQNYRPLLPDVRHLNFNEHKDLRQITERTAAVLVEPVQAEAGIIMPQNDFLKALQKRCKEVGALLILDEIQTGFGRTGTLFAFERFGILPDVLLLAKGMAGGMPMGAFVASREIMNIFKDNPVLGHITTFGGHAVSCAAALACLKTLLQNKAEYMDAIPQKEKLFIDLLQNHPHIKSIRSCGLMMAMEFENQEIATRIMHRCIANGVMIDWFLFAPNCLRIAPPLIISNEQIHEACAIIFKSAEEAVNSK